MRLLFDRFTWRIKTTCLYKTVWKRQTPFKAGKGTAYTLKKKSGRNRNYMEGWPLRLPDRSFVYDHEHARHVLIHSPCQLHPHELAGDLHPGTSSPPSLWTGRAQGVRHSVNCVFLYAVGATELSSVDILSLVPKTAFLPRILMETPNTAGNKQMSNWPSSLHAAHN